MKNIQVGPVVCLLCCVFAYTTVAQAVPTEKELIRVQDELDSVNTELQQALKQLHQAEHDAQYKDPELKRLYQESKALEARQLEIRKQMQARLTAVDEVRAQYKVRKKLFQQRDELNSKLSVLEHELASKKWAHQEPE